MQMMISSRQFRGFTRVAMVAATLLLLVACTGGRVEKTLTTGIDVAGAPDIFIDNFNGAIEITTGDAGRVEAAATLFGPTGEEATLDSLDFVFSVDGAQVRGAGQWIAGAQPADGAGIDLRLTVPAGANLEVRNGAGSIRYAGTPGESSLTLATGSGDIAISLPAATAFRVDARAAIGSIETNYALAASSTSTGATLTGMMGETPALAIDLATGNGKITLERQAAQ